LATEMDDGGYGVIDGREERGETEYGECDFEEGFVEGGGCEDGDDLFGRILVGGTRVWEVEGGVVVSEVGRGIRRFQSS